MIAWFIALPIAAYLVGSISFAWIAGKIRGVDLRQHGSGNLGATNAGRVLGGKWFATVFLADVAKGLLPVLAARYGPDMLGVDSTSMAAQGLLVAAAGGSIIGHVFTFFHGFKGGKAVATSLGALIGMLPLLAACLLGTWLLIWLVFALALHWRKSTAVGPASVLAAAAAIPLHLLLTESPFTRSQLILSCFVILMALLVLIRHRSNIRDWFTPAPAAG